MSDKGVVMTTKELADYIKIHEKTVIKQAQEGKIPGVKIGNQWRFHLDAIDDYLQKTVVKMPDDDLNVLIKTAEQIIPISRLTEPSLIALDLPANNQDEVLDAIAGIAKKANIISHPAVFADLLKQREELISTAVGKGIAVPHPRYPGGGMFKRPNIIITRTKKGIKYHAPDNKKVRLFFTICAPNEFIHAHLLAKVSKLLREEPVRNQLFETQTKEELMKILLEFDRQRIFPLSDEISEHKGVDNER